MQGGCSYVLEPGCVVSGGALDLHRPVGVAPSSSSSATTAAGAARSAALLRARSSRSVVAGKAMQWNPRQGGGERRGDFFAGASVRVSHSFLRCVASAGSPARHGEVKQEEKQQQQQQQEVEDDCECADGVTDASSAVSTNGRTPDAETTTTTTTSSGSSIPGLIMPPLTTVGKSTNIAWEGCMVKRQDRQRMLNQKGCVIWITGLSSSGKSTLACTLDHALLKLGKLSYVLDGDNVRHGLSNNLGFSADDRAENIRRVGEVAKLFADTGVICIASFISPYKRDRDACRQLMAPGDFIEVFMDVPLEVCEGRDPKGLYKLARAGKIQGFTGVDDPYEDPPEAEIVMKPLNGVCASPQDMTAQVLAYLEQHGFLRSA